MIFMINKEYDFSKYQDKDYIEFYAILDVYKPIADSEEYELVKKDVKCRKKVFKYDVSYIKEVYNSKGNIRTQRVEVGIKHDEPIIVLGRYRDIDKVIFDRRKPNNVGFKFY